MLSRMMTRREQLVIFLVAVAIVTGSVVLYVHDRQGAEAPAAAESAEQTVAPAGVSEPSELSAGTEPVEHRAAEDSAAGIADIEEVASAGLEKIDINLASALELESLPGIGPKLAAAIVAYREIHPFKHVDDLAEIDGIGPSRLDAIRDLVTVGHE